MKLWGLLIILSSVTTSMTLVSCDDNLLYTTKQGVEVYDELGLVDLYGWGIPKSDMDKCLQIITDVFPVKLDGVSIWFEPYPFTIPDGHGGDGLVYGLHTPYVVHIGLQPRCAATALAHELMHEYLLQRNFDSDREHKLDMYWEGGLVGAADDKLRAEGF